MVWMRSFLVLAALVTVPAWCGEHAVLANGFRIQADRHEVDGAVVRLYSSGGIIVLPVDQVARFEPDDPPPPQPPPVPLPVPDRPQEQPATDPKRLIVQAAERHGLPPELLNSVARAESGYRVDAISPKGAIGVMQLMPQTAATMSVDPFNAAENIEAGTRLLRDLLVKYDGSTHLALAAYNAGAGAVDKHKGIPPYRETQLYVDRVVGDYLRQTARKSTSTRHSE